MNIPLCTILMSPERNARRVRKPFRMRFKLEENAALTYQNSWKSLKHQTAKFSLMFFKGIIISLELTSLFSIRHRNYLLREICCSLYENTRLFERWLSKLSITLREWRCGRAEKCVEIRVEQLMNHHYYLEKKVARHDGFAKYRRTCNMHRHTHRLVTMFRKNGMSLVSEFANDCKIRKHLFWHSRNLLTYLPSYQS